MKILIVHNFYQQPGGERVVVEREIDLLRTHGHEVIPYFRSNDEAQHIRPSQLIAQSVWGRDTYRDLRNLIEREQPDIAHLHNTHFMISPSAVHACADAGVPVVMTLHNYRLVCPAATFFREGRVCEDCLNKWLPYPAVQHGCFRASRAQTAVIAATTTIHKARATWDRVKRFITPTAFARDKLIAGGFDPERILAKPHFLPDDKTITVDTGHHTPAYFIAVGRLSAEKGTHLLLEAWHDLPDVPLMIVGDGDLLPDAQTFVSQHPQHHIELLGRVEPERLAQLVGGALALVFPSTCYETFGNVIIEAFAAGTPVIAAAHGAASELITDGVDGWHTSPHDPAALAEAVRLVWDHPDEAQRRGAAARQTFNTRYTADRNYEQLMAIYEEVVR